MRYRIRQLKKSSKNISAIWIQRKQILEARLRGETEQGPSGNFPIKLVQKSIAEDRLRTKPKSVSEYRNLLVADRHHLLPKLEDFGEAQKIHLKYPKNMRKFVRARTERRLASESNDYVNIGYF
ncbi:hypothetical protein WUBG_12902 [Wuchereria bancrofti]|uniref:Uncharacterized protein n=1 Tax=Wuchereria bancrofti TaxID=6293 RepID=J9ELH6_WUCBA|nr:hypothetical protein WUBG_12902 [Wuchereria bancrofti]